MRGAKFLRDRDSFVPALEPRALGRTYALNLQCSLFQNWTSWTSPNALTFHIKWKVILPAIVLWTDIFNITITIEDTARWIEEYKSTIISVTCMRNKYILEYNIITGCIIQIRVNTMPFRNGSSTNNSWRSWNLYYKPGAELDWPQSIKPLYFPVDRMIEWQENRRGDVKWVFRRRYVNIVYASN